MPKKGIGLLTLYSIGHFFVDLACAFLMISILASSSGDSLIPLVTYNFCAFALQMPFGMAADRLDRNMFLAVIGLALVLCAFAFSGVPIAAAIVLGLGNCLFHIGGGVDILRLSSEREWMLGIFVSPGAVGLYLGTVLANGGMIGIPLGFVILALVFIILACLMHITYSVKLPSGNPEPSIDHLSRGELASAVLLFLVVVIRSYAGVTMTFPWKSGQLAVLAVIALALGKALGGYAADKFGAVLTSILSLALSGVLFIFSGNAVPGILTVLLFNMTMPITLFAMARILPASRGFAFGILTFALFIGYLPGVLDVTPPTHSPWLYALEAVLSLVLLALGLYFSGRSVRSEKSTGEEK